MLLIHARRVSSPARFRPLGYRAGFFPAPVPGSDPSVVTSSPTIIAAAPAPSPTAGPAIPQPATPPSSSSSGGDPFGLTQALQGALASWLSVAEVGLGAALLLVAGLILMAQTRTGGQLARSTSRTVKRAAIMAVK